MSGRSTLDRLAPDLATALCEWGRTAGKEAYAKAWEQLHALASVARWAEAAHEDDSPPWPRHRRMENAIGRLQAVRSRASGRAQGKEG